MNDSFRFSKGSGNYAHAQTVDIISLFFLPFFTPSKLRAYAQPERTLRWLICASGERVSAFLAEAADIAVLLQQKSRFLHSIHSYNACWGPLSALPA